MAVKPVCILDTSALMHLRETEVSSQPIYRLLWKEFEVRFCSEVHKEIARHSVPGMPDPQECTSRIHDVKQISHMEETLIGPTRSTRNKGERHNICVAYDLFRKREKQVIFLTDDDNARRSFIEEFFGTFKIGVIWSSMDLVLYLFLRQHKIFPQEMAQNALRTINALIAGANAPTTAPAKKEGRIRLLQNYSTRLTRIGEVLSRLRGN